MRRRLIIEWEDDDTWTDEECAKSFLAGNWNVNDLLSYPEYKAKIWVEDAP